MNTGDFEFLRAFLKDKAGFVIPDDKAYLLESRLLPVARRWRHTDIAALTLAMRGFTDPKLLDNVIEAVMDNDTMFFRDREQFVHLEENLLPSLIASRKSVKRLRIWCIGASTGQEAYSVAMLLKEMGVYGKGWRVEIAATDISETALQIASQGIYTQFEVQRGLPVRHLLEHFDQMPEQKWQLHQNIRQLVNFQRHNLINDTYPVGPFDLVLCRNVLSLFDASTRDRVLERVQTLVAKDGHLMIGANEVDAPSIDQSAASRYF